MTPKEKATDLVERFFTKVPSMTWGKAKGCALIAADEILKCYNWPSTERQYWTQVKQEIQNL